MGSRFAEVSFKELALKKKSLQSGCPMGKRSEADFTHRFAACRSWRFLPQMLMRRTNV